MLSTYTHHARARLPNAYVVVGRDGAVVTVGHRYRRVPRGR
jgi:hypothetical protein